MSQHLADKTVRHSQHPGLIQSNPIVLLTADDIYIYFSTPSHFRHLVIIGHFPTRPRVPVIVMIQFSAFVPISAPFLIIM